MKRAYETRDALYQHYNKLFKAGTKDFPQDHIKDLKLPFRDTLNKTTRGRTADKYYRSHHEIDTIIGHSLGGAVALSLEKEYKKEGNNPYGIIQSRTFGAPTVSGNISNPLLKKNIVKNEIVGVGAASGLAIGASADTAIGFGDGGLLSGLGADTGITPDTNTSPNIILYFGDPISAFDFNATTIMPPFKQRWNNSAHSYSGFHKRCFTFTRCRAKSINPIT